MQYRFTEHDKGYHVGRTLQPYRPQFAPIAELVPVGARVLDVGCGDGVLGERLIRYRYAKVYGFDLDPVGVAESRRKGVRARVWDANRRFPYRDKQFDVVVCNELLELCDNPNLIVSECIRTGKTAVVEFPNIGFIVYRLELLLGKFPHFALYGHTWWNTRMTKFFSYSDFLSLPSMKHVTIRKLIGINWRNREVGFLATLFPNLFARSIILEIIPAKEEAHTNRLLASAKNTRHPQRPRI